MIKLITFLIRFFTIFCFGGITMLLLMIIALILWDKKYYDMADVLSNDLFETKK